MGAVIHRIPPGAMVEIFNRKGDPVASGALLEDWIVSIASEYKQVITDKAPDALNWAGGALAQVSDGRFGFSGEFKQFGAALWAGTGPATFTFSLEFAMTYSGLEEVSKPIGRIERLIVPAETLGGNLIAPGPTILDVLSATSYTPPTQCAPLPNEISVPSENNYNAYDSLLSVKVGNLLFRKLTMTSAEPSLSKYRDDQGWPIYGRIAITMQTMYVPTKEDICEWFGLS